MTFREYPVNPTTLAALKAWKEKVDLQTILPEWDEELLLRPLTRIALYWYDSQGRSGLSPFAYAGLTKHSPSAIIKRVTTPGKEDFKDLQLCTEVHLPILMLPWYKKWSGPKVKQQVDVLAKMVCNLQSYDRSVLNFARDEERYPSWEPERTRRTTPWKDRTLEKMLARWGGATWRRHCGTKNFDPFHRVTEPIEDEQWANLKYSNTLGLTAAAAKREAE